ncbi:superoxide dismutase [Candidatus Uhrbacteria bacterium]|nr:superoxide dismutase [Candidatus Uhrbacteria bacterium]
MFEPKDYDHLLGTQGFSDQLLKNHFTLYQGYVKNTNTLLEEIKKLSSEKKQTTPQYAELKRRFGWEFDGMRLHELYFGNMKNGSSQPDSASSLTQKINEQFGNYQEWEKDFKATGAMRGIGWAILRYDKESGLLFNAWANEHDVGHLAGTHTLLILDVFEHAFMLDYGLKRADYIEAFFKAIDWSVVERRLKV